MADQTITVSRLQIKRSSTPGARPDTLARGEEFVNFADGIRQIGDGSTPTVALPEYPLRPGIDDVPGLPDALDERADRRANLSDLTDKEAARSNLGLGDAATRTVGTGVGSVAAGNDSRIVGALQALLLGATFLTPTGSAVASPLADVLGGIPIDACGYGLNANGPNHAFTNADGLSAAFDRGLATGRPVTISKPGTYWISYIDKPLTRNLEVRIGEGVILKGLPTKSEFTGDGTQTVFTVTDPWVAFIDKGCVVQTYSPTTKKYTALNEGTGFTRSGATFTLAVPPASGTLVRIVSGKDIVSFSSPGAIPGVYGFKWYGGVFDLSLRGLGYNVNSGGCLGGSNTKGVRVEGTKFIGRSSHWDSYENGYADTGFGGSIYEAEIVNCKFEGFGDLGIYLTGRNEAESHFKYGSVSIYGCHFYRCSIGFSAKRRMDKILVFGNTFEECGIGATLWPSSGNPGGSPGVIAGNWFYRCTAAIDTRNVRGVAVSDNVIVDWGYNPKDGTTTADDGQEIADQAAIIALGTLDSSFGNNTFLMRDWAKGTQVAYRFRSYTFEGVTFQSSGNVVTGGKIADCAAAFVLDAGAVNCSAGGVNLTNVTTVVSDASNSFRWRVVRDGVERWGKGNTDYVGSWTPTFLLAGGTFTGTYVVQEASYQRVGDEVTMHFKVQVNGFTHTETSAELRIYGIPFASVAMNGGPGHGAFGIISGITWPTGVQAAAYEVPSSNTFLRIRCNGTPNRFIQGQDIPTGGSLRLEGTVTYRAAA